MTSLFLAAAKAAAASSVDYNEWLICVCVALTLALAFGPKAKHLLMAVNKRYHIIGWDGGKERTIEWNEQH